MKSKRVVLGLLSLAVCLAVLAVFPVQARDIPVAVPGSGEEEISGMVLATVGVQASGGQATNVAIYDQQWGLVAQSPGINGLYSFGSVKPGAYHLVAYNDVLETSAAKDIEVKAGQKLRIELYLKRATSKAAQTTVAAIAPSAAPANTRTRLGCGTTAADGRFIKVFPSYGENIVYLQCGHVVAKTVSVGCSCQSSNYVYTYDCKKTQPIYVTLPCNRSRH